MIKRPTIRKRKITRKSVSQKGDTLTVMRRYFGVMRGPVDLGTQKAYRRNWSDVISMIAAASK